MGPPDDTKIGLGLPERKIQRVLSIFQFSTNTISHAVITVDQRNIVENKLLEEVM